MSQLSLLSRTSGTAAACDTGPVSILSYRWWFENRQTGEITFAQFPNWPMFAIGAGWLVGAVADDGSTIDRTAAIAVTGLWVYWGTLELIQGVNPWRRLLGAVIVVAQFVKLVT